MLELKEVRRCTQMWSQAEHEVQIQNSLCSQPIYELGLPVSRVEALSLFNEGRGAQLNRTDYQILKWIGGQIGGINYKN